MGLLLLAACGWLEPTPDAGLAIEELDVEGRPADLDPMAEAAIGPVIQVATGEVNNARFHFVAYQGVRGLCLAFDWEDTAGASCGVAPGEAAFSEMFGVLSVGGDGVTQDITGVADVDVADVWIELGSGARARAMLPPA